MTRLREAMALRWCAAFLLAMFGPPAAAYQPAPNVRVIARMLIEQDLQFGVSGGKSQLTDRLGLIVSSPRDVAMAYLGNEVAANQQYQGKVVALSGEALSIQAGYGDLFVEFARSGEWGVRAYFIPSETAGLAKLRRLETVNAVCKGRGVVMGVPIFGGCMMTSTWKRVIASDINRDVSGFYAGRKSNREAMLVGVVAVSIFDMLPAGTDCSRDDEACSAAIGAFHGLTDEQQMDRMRQAAEKLRGAGLKTTAE